MYEKDNAKKAVDLNCVDLSLEASMGRIKLVFVMKFINDILTFIEPFSGAQEIVVQAYEDAYEGATKNLLEAYARNELILRHTLSQNKEKSSINSH